MQTGIENPIPCWKEGRVSLLLAVVELEVKFAKQSGTAEIFFFPPPFSMMIFKNCNSYNSTAAWTVGTSQWLYVFAELCALLQAVCQTLWELWEIFPHQRAPRPDLNVGDSS